MRKREGKWKTEEGDRGREGRKEKRKRKEGKRKMGVAAGSGNGWVRFSLRVWDG